MTAAHLSEAHLDNASPRRMRNASEMPTVKPYRQDPSLFIRESRIGTSPPTSSRFDHNGHPTDLSPKDCQHFDRELEP